MKQSVQSFLMLLLIASLSLGITAEVTLAETARKPHDIQIFGGRASPYRISVAIADVLTKYHPWIRASAVETAGAEANIHMALEKGRDPNQVLLQASNTAFRAAYMGVGEWKTRGLGPQRNLRFVTILQGGVHFWVTNDPSIKTMNDFAGKTIAWLPGWDLQFEMFHESLRILGIHDKVKIRQMDFMAMYDALRDETIDGCLGLAVGLPGGKLNIVFPLVQAIEMKKGGIFLVSWPKEVFLPASKKVGLPVITMTVPSGTIPTQTESADAYWDAIQTFAALAEADEELIYEITKTLVQHYYRFREYLPALEETTPEIMAGLLPAQSEAEVHPGALKYYKEVGLWPAAWEKYHKKK